MDPMSTELPAMPNENKSKSKVVISLLIFSLLIVCIFSTILIIILLRNPVYAPTINENTTEQDTTPSYVISSPSDYKAEEVEEEMTVYPAETEHLSANLPQGWQIIEYNDESGMEMYVEDPTVDITGLTGFDIQNEIGTTIFSIKGVNGIGGSGNCNEYAVFSDTEQSYIDYVEMINSEVGSTPGQQIIIDDSEYTQVNFLGRILRRVGTTIYVQSQDYSSGFNADCGLSARFIIIPQINFTLMPNNIQTSAYSWEINPAASYSELLLLDQILNSFNPI